jgi:hypothetical protein
MAKKPVDQRDHGDRQHQHTEHHPRMANGAGV